jgi:FMN-dependent NADH-azoreductase
LTNSKEPTLLEIGAPIYNLGVPSGIKVWIDLAARAGRIFG